MRSVYQALRLHRGRFQELYQGSVVYLPINAIRSITLGLIGMDSAPQFLSQYVLSNVLTYPLLTLQRRMECHSAFLNGMLSLPTTSTPSASHVELLPGLRATLQNEGVKGLYRGFIGHTLIVKLLITHRLL